MDSSVYQIFSLYGACQNAFKSNANRALKGGITPPRSFVAVGDRALGQQCLDLMVLALMIFIHIELMSSDAFDMIYVWICFMC